VSGDADPRIWRVVGDPLAAPTGSGPLDGETVAVKDLFEVEGHALGLGNPAYLAEAAPATRTAPAVAALLAAGASLRGIAQTDEFAYSIAGANAHYGAPPNGAMPGALPGGSSSGPASAVAAGQASLGLGTDTAGSIRVPASYQGLWGLRTTHGAVSAEGVWPLAPTFDTVGWLARDADTLRRAVVATLGTRTAPAGAAGLAVAPALLAGLDPAVLAAFDAAIAPLRPVEVELPDPDAVLRVFRTVQPAEAWFSDGAWVSAHPGALGPGVAERFDVAAATTADAEAEAREELRLLRAAIDAALGDRVLLLPSASGAAPALDADAAELDAVRTATLRLCSAAGIAGRPALSVPLLTVPGVGGAPSPLGLCLVGPRGSDLALVDLAARLF